MEDTPGFISAYGIQGWWFDTFSAEERALMVSVLQDRAPELLSPGYVPTKSYGPDGVLRSDITSDLDSLTYSPVSKAENASTHAKVLRKKLEIQRAQQNIFGQHLTLMHLGDAYYKGRSDPLLFELAVSTYEDSVEFSDQAGTDLPWDGDLPSHPAAERLALIYTNAGRGEDALRILYKVKIEGWRGDWDKRISRCAKKLALAPELVEHIRNEVASTTTPLKQKSPRKGNDTKFVIPDFTVDRDDLAISVDMQGKTLEVTHGQEVRKAGFPPRDKFQRGLPWYEFISFVAAVTGRRGRRREGVNEWFLLETDPLDLVDCHFNEAPRFTLTRLRNDPYGVTNGQTALYKALSDDLSWVEEINKMESPGGPQSASLRFSCNHNGFRNSLGYILGPDQNIWKRERGLGGIITDDHFDLYSELHWTTEKGLADGFTPTGPWIGRFITGPENGVFEAEFFASATFEKPGFREPLWLED